jgi:SAM-dependent methyltransferase
MLNKIKQLVPSSWKDKLRKRFQSEVAKTEGFDTATARRIAELEKTVFDLQPELVLYTNEIKETILQNWQEKDISIPGNVALSKHDYMYQFLKHHHVDSVRAYAEYITSGAHMVKILKDIVEQTGRNFSSINAFLDFASGYGRLTRYMIELIKPGQIWISDIKQGAVDFQIQQFGVNGVLSSEDPRQFKLNGQFDLIFVGSLFSHLPDETFGKWLQRIYEMLSANGLLIFTVHDESLNKNVQATKQDIVYIPVSEELNLLSKDGRLPGVQYGTAFVSEGYVGKQIKNLRHPSSLYKRFIKGMWGLQDVYILSKNVAEDLSGVVL